MKENIPVFRLRSEVGDVVARDGIVLAFYMSRSHREVAAVIWDALQTYLRAIPPQSLGWYVSPDGDMLPLDDKGWEHIRQTVLERPWGAEWHVELREDPGETGGYHFEYDGRKLDDPFFARDKGATSAVSFTFPTEYLLEHGPAHLRALALEIARELPFSFGYAGPAFISPGGDWYCARRELVGLLGRYLGMDFYKLQETSLVIGTRARGAYWLTFLGQPLLGQMGGAEALRASLTQPDVSFEPMEGERLLLTLGEWPDALDTARKWLPAQYRDLALLLEPFLYDERSGWAFLENESMHRWIRRLCQPGT